MEKSKPLPPAVLTFLKGLKVQTKFDRNQEIKPSWYDEAKFKRGQQIARENFISIVLAEMLTLLLTYATKTSTSPLIFTGKSETPFQIFKRYLVSSLKIVSWYEEDPWDKTTDSYKNMAMVKRLHITVVRSMTSLSEDELLSRTTLKDPSMSKSEIRPILLKDFESSCPVMNPDFVQTVEGKTWLSQSDMTFVQFAFVALLAMNHKKNFGMYHVSDDDLEDYFYVWRCLGYLHGIDDEFNVCTGTLRDIRKRIADLTDHLLVPMFHRIDDEWEHMTRSVVEGVRYYIPFLDYEICMAYLCRILLIKVETFEKSLSTVQRCILFCIERVIYPACQLHFVYKALNGIMWFRHNRAKDALPGMVKKERLRVRMSKEKSG